MNSEEFVDAIRNVVWKSTVSSMSKLLAKSPGRSPSKELIEKSNWYNSLDEDDREMVTKIIDESARIAVFGFLCVLDGARAIEDGDKGLLKLYFEKDGNQILLNDQNRQALHDLL